jgi:hypothetical protein
VPPVSTEALVGWAVIAGAVGAETGPGDGAGPGVGAGVGAGVGVEVDITLSVTAVLVMDPAELVTLTVNVTPLSALVVGGVV